jgi:hypothetical protein
MDWNNTNSIETIGKRLGCCEVGQLTVEENFYNTLTKLDAKEEEASFLKMKNFGWMCGTHL